MKRAPKNEIYSIYKQIKIHLFLLLSLFHLKAGGQTLQAGTCTHSNQRRNPLLKRPILFNTFFTYMGPQLKI